MAEDVESLTNSSMSWRQLGGKSSVSQEASKGLGRRDFLLPEGQCLVQLLLASPLLSVLNNSAHVHCFVCQELKFSQAGVP